MKIKLLKIALCICLALSSVFAVGCSSKITFKKSDDIYYPARITSKVLGEVSRKLPQVKNGGQSRYPQYNTSLSGATNAEKQAVLDENNQMFDYDSMDKDGNLFKAGQPIENEKYSKLFKHSAAEGLYQGTIDDKAAAVSKKLYIQPAAIGNNITGLYAPPGEVVTIILNQIDATRNMRVDIGQGSARGGGVGIPVSRDYNRMPVLRKSMNLANVINYVGSPLGGPIYLHNENDATNRTKPYEVTIIGAVEMPTYIVGTTSDEEWERLRTSAGTLFDFEVYAGIRFTLPAKDARKLSAQDIKKLGVFWENASYLSNNIANKNWYSTHPVTMIYDTYVPAGAAVAFVGADFCSLPLSWASGILNYSQMMVSGGWGNLHEFNHHHQGWGSGNGGEVTNNVINSLTYMMFTNIGSGRTENGRLAGGNWVTDAYSSLKETLEKTGQAANHEVSTYVDIAHAFGEKVFMNLGSTNNIDKWYKEISKSTGYDMTYYLRDLCNQNVSGEAIAEISALSLPVFVPVASLYQAGRTVLGKDGESKDVIMGKPFYIKLGVTKEIDFGKYLSLPSNFKYEILQVTNPTYGSLSRGENNIFTYKPSLKHAANVDTFRVKLKLTEVNNAFVTPDVELILQFAQDGNGSIAKIWDNIGYSDISTALSEGFEKTAPKETIDFTYSGASHSKSNTFTEVSGKLAFNVPVERSFYIKGDDIVEVYGGTDKNKMEKVAYLDSALSTYDETKTNASFNLKLNAKQPWYYKIYILNKTGSGFCRIGWKDVSLVEGGKPIPEGGSGGGESAQKAPIIDLPSAYSYKTDADVNASGKSDFYTDRIYYKPFEADAAIMLDLKKAKVAKASPNYGNSVPSNMLDGNYNTAYHTVVGAYESHEIVVDLGEVKSFNTLRIYGRNDGNAAGKIKDYEIYTAVSLAEGWTLLKKDTAANNYLGINLVNNGQKARYIKVLGFSQYGNEKYIAISELQIGSSLYSQSLSPSNGSNIRFKGDWKQNNYGPHLNGALLETSKGSMSVTFHGTGVALFTAKDYRYGNALIRLDGGKWQSVNLFSTSPQYGKAAYIAANLPDGYHTLELKADKKALINLDYLAFNYTVAPPDKGLGAWWVLIILAYAVGAAGVAVGGIFTVRFVIAKKGAK